MASPPALGDVLTALVNAVSTIFYEIVSAFAANAPALASIIVAGLIVGAVLRYGRTWFSELRGLIPL